MWLLFEFYLSTDIDNIIIMAMEDCGFSKKDIRRVVGQLYEVFDLNSVEDAKEKYHSSPY